MESRPETLQSATMFNNPSDLPYELPDFAAVDVDTLVPAARMGMDDHAAELAAIADNPEEPTWENTIVALEASGETLQRVLAIIFNYAGALATEKIQQVESEVSPLLADHVGAMYLNEDLWNRVQSMPEQAEGTEEAAVLRRWRRRFVRGGANLDPEQREELKKLDSRLAELSTSFGTQLLRETEAAAVELSEDEVAGLSEATKARLKADAREANKDGYLVRLGLPTVQPILEELSNPEARRKVYQASLGRAGTANDDAILEIIRLRAHRAEMLGYSSHADFIAEEETAGSVEAVEELLKTVTPAAVSNAQGEYKRLADKQAVSDEAQEGGVEAADWPYWDAQLRAEELDVDDDELRKYFPLSRVMEQGAFFAAQRLYGITVNRREDLQGYHPDVTVWEVREEDQPDGTPGEGIGLILMDMFARPTKRGGAWMNSFVDQARLTGQQPVVVNVLNIAKPQEGDEALLSLDEVATVFHEFGHALHGLLSDVVYPSVSGTNVPCDFVEFPSQINENWALEPAVLANYARHVDTGEPLPAELLQAVQKQARWGQGFSTTEYVAACWVDLAWHKLSAQEAESVTSVEEFEAEALRRAGIDLDGLIAPRYRSAYFNHIFAGGYSAGYWSYLWAEVLDADGFQAFVDTDAAVGTPDGADGATSEIKDIDEDDVRFAGDRFRRMILSRGASIDYEDAFWMFRGQQRSVEPLLRRRGLAGSGA